MNNLKMKPEHYAALKAACEEILANTPNARAEYAGKGLSPRRFHWDVLYAAVIRDPNGVTYNGSRWVCDVLYAYLSDAHIDSALRRILGDTL